MDPVTVKFVQLILAEVFGAGICVAGIWVTFKGISGRMELLVEGQGLKAKLTNASPGFLLTALGVFLVIWSLTSKVKQETTESRGEVPGKEQLTEPSIYDYWLSNATKLTGDEPVDQLLNTLVGPNAAAHAVVMTIRPDKDTNLAQIATEEYGEAKYWPLLALLNRHLLKPITEQTTVGKNKAVRAVKKSKLHGFDRKTVIEIKREDTHRTFDELLAMAQKTKSVDEVGFNVLMEDYKKKEVYLALTPLKPSGGVTNLGELSLQLYGDKKYWPLVVWMNPQAYPGDVSEQTAIPAKTPLEVITIMD